MAARRPWLRAAEGASVGLREHENPRERIVPERLGCRRGD